MQKLFFLVALLSIAFLIVSVWQEATPEWKKYQNEYYDILAEKVRDGSEFRKPRLEIKQVWSEELGVTDRCMTCHLGIENPLFVDAPQPFATHPGDILKRHPSKEFGCTLCHEGQGYAVDLEGGHGRVEHWERPLLEDAFLESSCGRCHYENELFGVGAFQADIYAVEDAAARKIYQGELDVDLAGTPMLKRAKEVIVRKGCLGCHKYRGKGGVLGPDITHVGDKTDHEFDFSHLEGEKTVVNWLYQHFKAPKRISPDTMMPNLNLSDEDAMCLTIYMLNLKKKALPAKYTPVPKIENRNLAAGSALFQMFCGACHGETGEGSNVPGIGAPTVNNPDFLSIASDGYFHRIVSYGRPGTKMIRWDGQLGGLHPDEIDAIIKHIRSWEKPPPDTWVVKSYKGVAKYGRSLYRAKCSACHGAKGEGGIGTALMSKSFLAAASDDYIIANLINGRPDTAMPSWRMLTAREMSDLIAFLRSGYSSGFDKETVLTMKTSKRIGKRLYRSYCSKCHGAKGEGDIGPKLNNQDFLAMATKDFLYETITKGRPGTGMPSWAHLQPEDIADLIGFIKSWQKVKEKELSDEWVAGDEERGRSLFASTCARCHGANGEGGVGPQLNNPVFLASALDSFLEETLKNGRAETPMRSILKGSQGLMALSLDQIHDIVRYIRSWEDNPPSEPLVAKYVQGSAEEGARLYEGTCAQCHGLHGEGKTGPAHANRTFLDSASDGFLQATLVLGREGTEMRSVAKGSQGNVQFTKKEMNDIIAFMRSWRLGPTWQQATVSRKAEGNAELGAAAYASYCAGCHGRGGEGAVGPSLKNIGFLDAASDGFIQAIIAKGRVSTPMRSFGKGTQGIIELDGKDINNLVAFIRGWQRELWAKADSETQN